MRPAGPPVSPPAGTLKKSSMKYHLFKVEGSCMTPEQKFAHAIKVRNRTLGPVKGTTISPHLDVEVTNDNKKFLQLSPDDLNMFNVLQESTCRHGKRRRVARRALNALGGISGLCGFVNGPKQMKNLKSGLQFVESLEEIQHADKERKRAAKQQRKKERK